MRMNHNLISWCLGCAGFLFSWASWALPLGWSMVQNDPLSDQTRERNIYTLSNEQTAQQLTFVVADNPDQILPQIHKLALQISFLDSLGESKDTDQKSSSQESAKVADQSSGSGESTAASDAADVSEQTGVDNISSSSPDKVNNSASSDSAEDANKEGSADKPEDPLKSAEQNPPADDSSVKSNAGVATGSDSLSSSDKTQALSEQSNSKTVDEKKAADEKKSSDESKSTGEKQIADVKKSGMPAQNQPPVDDASVIEQQSQQSLQLFDYWAKELKCNLNSASLQKAPPLGLYYVECLDSARGHPFLLVLKYAKSQVLLVTAIGMDFISVNKLLKGLTNEPEIIP